jgi:transposase
MITIPAVRERCAGIDVGKRGIAVAVMTGPADKEAAIQTRWLGTTVPELEALREWLLQEKVTSVAMESTGSYWIPIKNVLEKSIQVVLVCSKKHHPKKGEKTDFRDAIHLAHLHRHGMLTGSYLPERGIVELRDLTRRRKKLLGNLASEKNRIQKVLEVANVKIGNVITDVFGISGQEMLEALLSGREIAVEEIAGMAKTQLKTKIPQLIEALKGHQMNDHHRWLIQQSIDPIVLLDRQLEELEDRIMMKIEPYRQQFDLICTVPGFKEMNAAALLAEMGPDMSVFPDGDHLCSWGGACSGNNRSAGKSKSGR